MWHWGSGGAQKEGPGCWDERRAGVPCGSPSSPLCWCLHPRLETFAFSQVLDPRGTLLSPDLLVVPHGFSNFYLQSFAPILPPQEAIPDYSSSFHGSSNNKNVQMCDVLCSVDMSKQCGLPGTCPRSHTILLSYWRLCCVLFLLGLGLNLDSVLCVSPQENDFTPVSVGRAFQAQGTASAETLREAHISGIAWKPEWLERSEPGGVSHR